MNGKAQSAIHIVDDDDAVRDSLKTLFESYGLDVAQHRSAVDFLDGFEAGLGGCLVLDLHLPVLGGLGLITIMRERNIRLPVIFITGRSDRETRERAMRAGAVAFLDKPVQEGPLMTAIAAALEQAGEGRRTFAGKLTADPKPPVQSPSEPAPGDFSPASSP